MAEHRPSHRPNQFANTLIPVGPRFLRLSHARGTRGFAASFSFPSADQLHNCGAGTHALTLVLADADATIQFLEARAAGNHLRNTPTSVPLVGGLNLWFGGLPECPILPTTRDPIQVRIVNSPPACSRNLRAPGRGLSDSLNQPPRGPPKKTRQSVGVPKRA